MDDFLKNTGELVCTKLVDWDGHRIANELGCAYDTWTVGAIFSVGVFVALSWGVFFIFPSN